MTPFAPHAGKLASGPLPLPMLRMQGEKSFAFRRGGR